MTDSTDHRRTPLSCKGLRALGNRVAFSWNHLCWQSLAVALATMDLATMDFRFLTFTITKSRLSLPSKWRSLLPGMVDASCDMSSKLISQD